MDQYAIQSSRFGFDHHTFRSRLGMVHFINWNVRLFWCCAEFRPKTAGQLHVVTIFGQFRILSVMRSHLWSHRYQKNCNSHESTTNVHYRRCSRIGKFHFVNFLRRKRPASFSTLFHIGNGVNGCFLYGRRSQFVRSMPKLFGSFDGLSHWHWSCLWISCAVDDWPSNDQSIISLLCRLGSCPCNRFVISAYLWGMGVCVLDIIYYPVDNFTRLHGMGISGSWILEWQHCWG